MRIYDKETQMQYYLNCMEHGIYWSKQVYNIYYEQKILIE